MNYSIIFNIIGWVIKVEGFLMLFPALVALIYKENNIGIFFGCAAVYYAVGKLLT